MKRLVYAVTSLVCGMCVSMTVFAQGAAPLPLPDAPLPTLESLSNDFAPTTDSTFTPTESSSTSTDFSPQPMTDSLEQGVSGSVNVPRLHVRSGPNSERYEIITTILKDTQVTIYGESNGWYSIAYPQSAYCYVRSIAVQGEVPAVIPESGIVMTAGTEALEIRVRPWSQSTAIAALQPGTNVTILGRKGRGNDEFYRILPPADVRAWVKASYITRNESTSLPVSIVPTPGNLGTTEKPATKPEAKKEDPTQPQKSILAEAIRTMQAEMIARQQEEERQQKAYLENIDAQLAAIERDTENRKNSIVAGNSTAQEPAQVEPLTGWVEFTGRGLKRPAAYRLVKGGQVLFLLRSASVDLEHFANKLVAIDGTIEIAPGWEANIMDVTSITLLGAGPTTDTSDSDTTSTLSGDDMGTLEFLPAKGAEEAAPIETTPLTESMDSLSAYDTVGERAVILEDETTALPAGDTAIMTDDSGSVEMLDTGATE